MESLLKEKQGLLKTKKRSKVLFYGGALGMVASVMTGGIALALAPQNALIKVGLTAASMCVFESFFTLGYYRKSQATRKIEAIDEQLEEMGK